jgi:alpha-mannosidase
MITETLDRLRQCSQQDIQTHWRAYLVPEGEADLMEAIALHPSTWRRWSSLSLNDRHHLPWPQGRRILWLSQRISVPSHLHHYPLTGLSLRLAIAWWAEVATIYVNGARVQDGDLFDCATRILLSAAVQPGDPFEVVVRLESPGHDPGALVRSQCIYETPYPADSEPEPGFVADEIAVVQRFLAQGEPAKQEALPQILEAIAWETLPDRAAFDRSLATVRQQLCELHACPDHQMWLTGHAHLDMAWLWPVAETWEAAERTFRSVLDLQQAFPELIFCHSTPALYAWMETHRPELFAEIQAQVAAGRWEIVAGLWIEPELNIIAGESIVRQVLYGQRYVQQRFGQVSAIAWLPDSFGFCWQLPQILKGGGVDCFVTQKLRWNDTTQFPYDLFQWRSPDGTEILAYHSPLIGESIQPTRMADYACDWEEKTGQKTALWLPGVGDHGGGPTRDMLDTYRRWQQSPLFPTLKFATVQGFLEQVTSAAPSARADQPAAKSAAPIDLPVWNDELYLELHRGCYTTHADQKWYNRRCEAALYQAELFSSIATLITGVPYPHDTLEQAWKQVLFNQFHDILPGSSIPQVFVDANRDWQSALDTADALIQAAIARLATEIDRGTSPTASSYPVVVFNALNWGRSPLVEIPLPNPDLLHWRVQDATGTELPQQITHHPPSRGTAPGVLGQQPPSGPHLLVALPEVPSLGYVLLWLTPESPSSPTACAAPEDKPSWTLENDGLRVVVDPTTGNLAQVWDKRRERDVLTAPGNQLQAFRDAGQYWDAWNLAPDYGEHPLPAPTLEAIAWVESGALRQRLRVIRRLGSSRIEQDYVLDAGSPLLQIETCVDWQESQVVLKAAFPLNLVAETVACEMPFGVIQRSTRPQTEAERAKWEIPALQWADLSDPSAQYGVSLLNDCKYGYDAQPSQLRLTLLKAPHWPDPHSDRGYHQFRYALYSHAGDWAIAATVKQGYEFNQPVQIWVGTPLSPDLGQDQQETSLPASGSFLHLSAPTVILSAFKPSEDCPDQWILRWYESQGAAAGAIAWNGGLLTPHLDFAAPEAVNLLEQPLANDQDLCNQPPEAIAPWKIGTVKLKANLED